MDVRPTFYAEEEKALYDTVMEEPYIVHFTSGRKPWNEPGLLGSNYFWEIARTNVYYEELLFKGIGVGDSKALQEADLIRKSASYRIGRFITFIPRKIRGGLRCFGEHGWRYTLDRL